MSPFGEPKFFEDTAWYEVGSGPPVLLIHGWPMNASTWRHLAPLLAPHHRVVMIDLLGLGESRFDASTDFRVEAHAARLKAFVEANIDGPFTCIASDTGATIARYLAASAPSLRRLVLLNTEMPGHRPPWIRWYQALFAVPGGGLSLWMMTRMPWLLKTPLGFGGCFVDLSLLGGEFHQLFIEPMQSDARRREGVMRYLRGIDWHTVDLLLPLHRALTCDVEMIWGADDPTFPIGLAREMTTQFARPAPLTEISGAKLMVHEEKPQAVADAFLRKG